ncbi:DUF2851 family protein [Xanthocytophaga agilis]|uniref:DUF2851 family protein n=1 Tax=Xanthocytophaga agilis TaxID=3048010 RepID=A0AAE3RBM9_9BACT|nr:DUF2851 family protein [Xanthocytophaga agilis]MDJ1504532.1 DUF2851 family protein [Xanthocytophaga agilis]
MQESFLHFLWQFQYFSTQGLQTTDGRQLQVIKPGIYNSDAGPDFTQARIVVGGIEWAGNIEMHLRSSDWQVHRHQQDKAYENVVLHVVWEHNLSVHHPDGTEIPVLILESHTDKNLLSRYQTLLQNMAPIACASQFSAVKNIHRRQALDKALMSRLHTKAIFVKELYQNSQQHWDETAYQVLAHAFGFKINSEPMLSLAQSLPLKILYKHANSLLQIEALLFGQAGLIPLQSGDSYVEDLRREYIFLKHKYQLHNTITAAQWKFLRLRPANFPTLRIAQLAMLIYQKKSLFSSLFSLQKPEEILTLMDITPSAYWQKHYHFGKESNHEGSLGKDSQHNLLINSVVPLLSAYAEIKNEHQYIEHAVFLLERLPSENNKITRLWKSETGLDIRTAFDSQASIELYNHSCCEHRCLSCPIGVSLVKQKTV